MSDLSREPRGERCASIQDGMRCMGRAGHDGSHRHGIIGGWSDAEADTGRDAKVDAVADLLIAETLHRVLPHEVPRFREQARRIIDLVEDPSDA